MLMRINKKLKSKKGFSSGEYAIVITVLLGAIATITPYMQRAFQGRMKASADNLVDTVKTELTSAGASDVSGVEYQFEPGYLKQTTSTEYVSDDARMYDKGASYYEMDSTSKSAKDDHETTLAPGKIIEPSW